MAANWKRWRASAVGLFLIAFSLRAVEPGLPELHLEPTDRILVLAPHPDDEVIGCAGVIQQALEKKLPVRVVFLTHGDNNEWSFMLYRKRLVLFPGSVRRMGEVRHGEALAAGKLLGLAPAQMMCLGYPDFATLKIWNGGWDEQPAIRGMLTRVRAVPYPDAFRPGAPYKGEEIVKDLMSIISSFRPTKVFVSHPGDHNADHRALYLFTRVALWNLEKRIQPAVFPYLIHYERWPKPRGYQPDAPLLPPGTVDGSVAWQTLPLTAEQTQRKAQALKAHRSQTNYARKYLESFVRPNELFGDYPTVQLATAHHAALAGVEALTQSHEVVMSDELTEQERARFVGVEWRYVEVKGNDLVFAIHLTRPLAREVEASVYAFGYRSDYSFVQMPKLHLKMSELGSALFDQQKKLPRGTAVVERDADDIVIRIPLQALGNPRRLLTSARTYIADVPLDWAPWRTLELTKIGR